MIDGKQKPERTTDVTAIKKRIEDKDIRSTLVSVLDASEELLTELVGEAILDDSAKNKILADSIRTEVNKRMLKWLTSTDDVSTFEMFLAKLRQHGQNHVANFLDGTPGELPLQTKVRQNIQKIMIDLTKNINPDSGLLETLVSVDVISDTACEEIKAEKTKSSRTKTLLNILLRGSDKAFEKFLDELMKYQPLAMEIINKQGGEMTKPHVELLKVNHEVFLRCTDINLLTIAVLRSEGVIDGDMEDGLNAKQGLQKLTLMYNWLMNKPVEVYQAFIRAMQDNEQKHVANLLSKNSAGHQPMSMEKYDRLIGQRPHLLRGIISGIELASALLSEQASEDSDFAISKTDYEDITQGEKTRTARNSVLINAILRRTDFSYDSLEKALRQTSQEHYADLLIEGEIVGAHVNTTRPDKERDLSNAWNGIIVDPKLYEENHGLKNSINELKGQRLQIVDTETEHSIMVYTYCKTPEDMKTYVKLLNSGRLQTIFENILNRLLEKLEGEHFQPLEAAVMLEEEDKMLVQRFTGLDGNEADFKNLPLISYETCTSHGYPMSVYCFDCKKVICSSCIDHDHKAHKHSDPSKSSDDLREQLQKDLTLISSCQSNSLQRKEIIENNRKQFLQSMEESEKAVVSRCEDLKQRLERFKEMLIKERATFKQQILHDMDKKKRAIESYLAVFKDYEDYTKSLMERGSASDICQSFTRLHERATKLQQVIEPVTDIAVSDKNDEWMNQMPWFTSERVAVNPTVELTKEFVLEHRNFLLERMDPDLEQLLVCGALSKVNVDEVGMLPMREDKNKKILDIVITENKFKELGFAFLTSKQSHLVNYVCSNGEYKPQFGDDWPLMDAEINFLDLSKKYLASLFGTSDLLTMLCSMSVINSKQKELIASKTTLDAKSDALLVILKRGALSDFRKISFLLMIRQVLHQEMLRPQQNPLELFRPFLEECMDPYFGLVEALSLPSKYKKKVKSEHTPQKKNAKLLDFILKNEKYKELITALTSMNQTHIVNFLNANGVYDPKFGGNWPLTIHEIQILETNRKYLVENLQPQPLLEKLHAAQVISIKQKDFILAKHGFRERNEALLGMLKRGSLDNYRKIVECLCSSNQSNIAQILGQGVAQQSQVNVTVRVQNVNKELAELVNSFNQLIASRCIL